MKCYFKAVKYNRLGDKGFSLVETMAALTILSIISSKNKNFNFS